MALTASVSLQSSPRANLKTCTPSEAVTSRPPACLVQRSQTTRISSIRSCKEQPSPRSVKTKLARVRCPRPIKNIIRAPTSRTPTTKISTPRSRARPRPRPQGKRQAQRWRTERLNHIRCKTALQLRRTRLARRQLSPSRKWSRWAAFCSSSRRAETQPPSQMPSSHPSTPTKCLTSM